MIENIRENVIVILSVIGRNFIGKYAHKNIKMLTTIEKFII